MLSSISDLYLTMRVLILLDMSYISRFWTLLEAWCAMKTTKRDGLHPCSDSERRYDVACMHNAPTMLRKVLIDLLHLKSPQQAYSMLAVPDITVTNAKDKDLQLPVILKANLHAKEVLAIMAGTENGRKPPPAGGGAGIFLGCWKGGRHQAKVESEL